MTTYTLENGYVLTDDEIEKRARAWEEGTWEGQLVELRANELRLSDEPNVNMPPTNF